MMTSKDSSTFGAFLSGSLSSAATTVIYQPLELLKTRIQLHDNTQNSKLTDKFGKFTKSAIGITREKSLWYLWRGTGASLLRSVPGVGLYYASLNALQTSLSNQHDRPDGPLQAFCFGLIARSMVSYALLPVTVVKVRYESGFYSYTSLLKAVKDAYLRVGWIGTSSTITRDALFSAIYYTIYTRLKEKNLGDTSVNPKENLSSHTSRTQNFLNGCLGGIVASIVTNPFDVVKTNIQASDKTVVNMRQAFPMIIRGRRGYLHLFDGLILRTLRRTLISATTWTIFECMMTGR